MREVFFSLCTAIYLSTTDELPTTHSSEATPSFINFGLSASLYILHEFAHIYQQAKGAQAHGQIC